MSVCVCVCVCVCVFCCDHSPSFLSLLQVLCEAWNQLLCSSLSVLQPSGFTSNDSAWITGCKVCHLSRQASILAHVWLVNPAFRWLNLLLLTCWWMSLNWALNVKYWPFGEFGIAISSNEKRWERCECISREVKWCISDSAALFTLTYTHLSPPGTPFPSVSLESGPSLLTERITAAEKGSYRVVKDSERKRGMCHIMWSSLLVPSQPAFEVPLPLSFPFH